MIFLGTDGDDAEFRWWMSEMDGDATRGMGAGTDETFGDWRALEQLVGGTLVVGPALEDRPSSPLLLFPVSMSQTIKHRAGITSSNVTVLYVRRDASWWLQHTPVARQLRQKGFLFLFYFSRAFATPLFKRAQPPTMRPPRYPRSARCPLHTLLTLTKSRALALPPRPVTALDLDYPHTKYTRKTKTPIPRFPKRELHLIPLMH